MTRVKFCVIIYLIVKLYYSIGEVVDILGVKPHTVRYWAREFKLEPKKRGRRRLYQKKDIDDLLLIKELLYEKGYAIKGVQKRFEELKRERKENLVARLEQIREGIIEIVKMFEESN